VGDRNYWSPALTAELRRLGLWLLAPHRWASRDPTPVAIAYLSRMRYRIDTVFSQLVARGQLKRVWARNARCL
jgi:nuclear transport factor 2 (NTF2) superfamily protein